MPPILAGLLYGCLLCLSVWSLKGQTAPSVSATVDTTSIRIGEQVQWKVTVEVDTAAQVFFPEGQTFSPLETVEAFATDTTRKKDRLTLQKIYALTQFDSGAYKLPAQRIEINGVGYFTDSMMIAVATVPVDTLAQKMYDIKPLINVDKSYPQLWKYVLAALLALGLLAGGYYWFFVRKKPLTAAEEEALLPPYDRALLELKRLENSKYLIQDEYKAYYSELTDIVRAYLEEDAHVPAMESTTDQLIEKLELLKDSGTLKLEPDTIAQFRNILQTADLVKFAKSKPPTSVAEQDRKTVELLVQKTHDALPEPTEEDLLEQAEYQEELARQKQKKRLIIGLSSVVGAVVVAALIFGFRFGFTYLKDSVFGHPTKELLEGEWIRSAYGYPPIILETPQVLVRQETPLSPQSKAQVSDVQVFAYQNPKELFTISAHSVTLAQQAEPEMEQTVEQILQGFEAQGAKNIITKQEEFNTVSGVTGVKVFGSGKFSAPNTDEGVRAAYAILLFGGPGFQQYTVLTWKDDDAYAQEMVDRILDTLEVKTDL
ncbi:hypothetical protein [Maribacter sp. 2307ULW6-5]|uniref:hypothetical protein n=1 Tax=Maribacter sp. 2307ULW6-5 TaxID=3386275 RepID=UPI0039BC5B6B